MSEQFDTFEEDLNPIDSVEDVLHIHNWKYDRVNSDELTVSVNGKGCSYKLYFAWQEDMGALQLCFQYDLPIEANNDAAASSALRSMNENLWLGHFELPAETGAPCFRYTCMLKGLSHSTMTSTLENIVDIALVQCERYHPVFQLLSSANDIGPQGLSLALMETMGES